MPPKQTLPKTDDPPNDEPITLEVNEERLSRIISDSFYKGYRKARADEAKEREDADAEKRKKEEEEAAKHPPARRGFKIAV